MIKSKPYTQNTPPRRILAVRLQAMGDLVITLPYLQYLKNSLPENTTLDLLTRKEVDDIPKNIILFNKIYSIKGRRNFKLQLLSALLLLPKLFLKRYDVVIDLQNNEISNWVRKSLLPKAWSSFDRYSPIAAGERTRLTIEAAALGNCLIDSNFKLKNKNEGIELLKKSGWNSSDELFILNPAGAFENRNWPIDNYIHFASLWLQRFPKTQFLILGTGFIKEKAIYLKHNLGNQLIDLVEQTTPAQAFAIVQKAKLVLSEDSGLMHMAWVSGIPTIALFGSTRSDWAKPLGTHTAFFDSSDLECGNCMKPVCKYNDNHCMTRITPEIIFRKAVLLTEAIK